MAGDARAIRRTAELLVIYRTFEALGLQLQRTMTQADGDVTDWDCKVLKAWAELDGLLDTTIRREPR